MQEYQVQLSVGALLFTFITDLSILQKLRSDRSSPLNWEARTPTGHHSLILSFPTAVHLGTSR
jgi:hypothetical protein